MTSLDLLIRKYEELEIKQDNGTITMCEDAIRNKIYQRIDSLLFKK